MTINLITGNCISFAAALFTAKSSLADDRRHIYLYQVAQCLLLAAASIFFNSYAGIVTLLICALRNYLAAYDKLSRGLTVLCAALMLVLGLMLNNRGITGRIVIAANVIYTIGMHFAVKELSIKLNIILNLTLWIVYEILIVDIPSIIADAIGLGSAVYSLLRRKINNSKSRQRS